VKYEIVNDLDGYVVNYLRAVKYAPEEVARYLDFPRAELELIAYHHYTRDRCRNSLRGSAAIRTTTIRFSRRGGCM
jgi:hypothetical protein